MNYLKVCQLTKQYGSVNALNHVNLDIQKGEFVVLFGPNGCGKTTLLNIIAGIDSADSGSVLLEGNKTTSYKIGYVFQNYRDSLLPWKTNLQNIVFPLELTGDKARLQKAHELIETIGIKLPINRYPYQCSGGQQQLVALLREVLCKPKVLLMDEPFSALDHQSRKELARTVKRIHKLLNLTIIFVTHDLLEAETMGDKVHYMKQGNIVKTTYTKDEKQIL